MKRSLVGAFLASWILSLATPGIGASLPSESVILNSSGKPVLGIWSDGINGHTTRRLELQIGRRFRGFRNNSRIFLSLPSTTENRNFDVGRRAIVRNATSNRLVNGRKVAVCWNAWASGSYDWRLAQIVRSIRADRRFTHQTPYVFAFVKEMNLNERHHPTCGTAAEYKLAARHVFNYFLSVGLLWRTGGQVVFAWVPSGSAFRDASAKNWDPDLGTDGKTIVGDYYDLVGEDIYDRTQPNRHLRTLSASWLFDPAHAYAVLRGKELIIPEFGVGRDLVHPGIRAIVFSRVLTKVASYGSSGPGSLAGLYYSNVRGYWVDTSGFVLAAFRGMANSSFWAG